jgi:quercetin dioxygenase-like cupin family protein
MPERVSLHDPDGEPHADLFAVDRPRAVRLSLEAGQELPVHSHPGMDVVVHVVEGRLTMVVDGEPYALSAGDLLRFEGGREVAPAADTAATAVVLLAPQPQDAD